MQHGVACVWAREDDGVFPKRKCGVEEAKRQQHFGKGVLYPRLYPAQSHARKVFLEVKRVSSTGTESVSAQL